MNPKKIGLIDDRNERLWEDLSKRHKITLQTANTNSYLCNSKNQTSTIFIPKNNICIDSFTHELLHVLLRDKGIYFGASLKNLISGNNTLSLLITDKLITHFGNCFDHIKMLPIYLELGFDVRKFLADYEENKCTDEEIKDLKNNFVINGSYSKSALDQYIGKFIAIKADPNQFKYYPKCLTELNELDTELYEILGRCFKDWKEMPLEKENIWDSDYYSISYDFYENLNT